MLINETTGEVWTLIFDDIKKKSISFFLVVIMEEVLIFSRYMLKYLRMKGKHSGIGFRIIQWRGESGGVAGLAIVVAG